MTHAGYLLAGYGITFAVLAGYAWWLIARRRSLSRLVEQAPSPATADVAGAADPAGIAGLRRSAGQDGS